jgi:hypothetical protein
VLSIVQLPLLLSQVVANRAIEHVVAEDAVECLNLRGHRFALTSLQPAFHRLRRLHTPGRGGPSFQPCRCHPSEPGRVEDASRHEELSPWYG